jgi:hypothetical protein
MKALPPWPQPKETLAPFPDGPPPPASIPLLPPEPPLVAMGPPSPPEWRACRHPHCHPRRADEILAGPNARCGIIFITEDEFEGNRRARSGRILTTAAAGRVGALVVAGGFLPGPAARLGDALEVTVALRWRDRRAASGRRFFTRQRGSHDLHGIDFGWRARGWGLQKPERSGPTKRWMWRNSGRA